MACSFVCIHLHIGYFIMALIIYGSNAYLSRNIQYPLNLGGLNGLLNLASSSSSTPTNIGVQINVTGLGNLTAQQQQVVTAALLNGLLGNNINTGGSNSLAGLFGGGSPGTYGLQLGNYLGTSGLAAAAAQTYQNPFASINASPFTGGFGVGGLGGSLGGLLQSPVPGIESSSLLPYLLRGK